MAAWPCSYIHRGNYIWMIQAAINHPLDRPFGRLLAGYRMRLYAYGERLL